MTKQKIFLAAGMASMLGVTGMLFADQWDKKTEITVKEAIQVPGKTLPPGKYVLKLFNSNVDRHVVQIFNERQDKVEATLLAFNNYRLRPTGETVLSYWETPAGSQPALRAWFYPGDNYGQEFAYPKEMAAQISQRNNNAEVPSFEGNPSDLVGKEEPSISQNQSSQALNDQPVNPQPETAAARFNASPARDTTTPKPISEPQLLAQNQNQPLAPAAQTPPAREPSELPQTASLIPLIAMGGMILIAFATALHWIRS